MTEVVHIGDPDEPATLPAVLRARAELTPDATCLTFDGERRTFAQMHAAACRTAAALASLGVRTGSPVAALLPNSTEILDVWLGTALLGAVFVPINTGLRGDGLRYVVEHSGTDVVVLDAPLVEVLDAAVPVGTGPRHRYVRGPVDPPRGYGSLSALTAADHPPPRPARVEPGDLASILYTSGTTGRPKGVLNCHNSFVVAANEFTRRYVRVRADDVLYTSLPLFHVNAQALTVTGSLVSGAPMIVAPRFSASGFVDDLRRHGATVFNYIGAMLSMLYAQSPRPDDASVPARLAIGGAAPTPLWPRFEERFGLTVLELYGLTESATFCMGNPPDDIRVGTVGRPTSWSEVQIAGPDGETLPDGEPGEITVRGTRPDTMFLGYHRDVAATHAVLDGGWFRTGDRGIRDGDGYVTFLDRIKDSIRRRGENISPSDIERVAVDHQGVEECAAVGVPSDLGEDDVLLVVVPGPEGLDHADLVAFCRDRMAGFMVPRYVRTVDRPPRTATQRVETYRLRAAGVRDAWDRFATEEVG